MVQWWLRLALSIPRLTSIAPANMYGPTRLQPNSMKKLKPGTRLSVFSLNKLFSANILLDNSPVCCGVFSARRHVLHARRLHLQGSTHSNRTDYILHPALLAWIQRWYGCFCFCWPRRLLSLAYECGECSPRFLRTWCRAASSILYFASACAP